MNMDIDLNTGCHISRYSVASNGYAQIGWWEQGKNYGVSAHCASWVATHGQIPDGMTVDHTCFTLVCVNVAHLRLLTNFHNAQRQQGRDWPLGECVNGHPEWDRVRQGRQTVCRLCNLEWQRQYRARRKARV